MFYAREVKSYHSLLHELLLMILSLLILSSLLQSRQPYRVCSALLPIKDELSTTLFAKATFNQGSVGGAIYFVRLLTSLALSQGLFR